MFAKSPLKVFSKIVAANTISQYEAQAGLCRDIFYKKARDYGTSWRVLRLSSLADQIFIKAQRIRTIDMQEIKMVAEEMDSEFIGIVNYAIIALIRLQMGAQAEEELDLDVLMQHYDSMIQEAKDLMVAKNHDYGEAWRDMLISSFTDLVMMRILRIRSIAAQDGNTLISEGIDANLYDIINYAMFALIKIEEGQ